MGKVVLCLKDVNLRNAGRLIDDLNVKWTECLRKNLDFSHLRVKSILFVKMKSFSLHQLFIQTCMHWFLSLRKDAVMAKHLRKSHRNMY